MLQKCIFLFCFLETTETQQTSNLTTSNTPNEVNHEKNCFETRRSMVEIRRFNIELSMSICARENFSHPAQFCLFLFFLLEFHSHCCQILQARQGLVFYIYIYFFDIETKLKHGISQNSNRNFFTAHIVTQMSEVI